MRLAKGYPPNFLMLFAIALLGGILLNLAWAPHPFTFLVFIALVPFLFVASNFSEKPTIVFAALFSGFLVFHVSAAWWMYSSTIAGSLLAHLLNAFLPAATLSIWAASKARPLKPFREGLLLITLWISMEWLNAVWPLAWPWFQLGHVFGSQPKWVQWFSLTSSAGGTVWVLVVNYLMFRFIWRAPTLKISAFVLIALAFAMPFALNKLITKPGSYGNKISLAVVQPNIHPQREKFGTMDASEQLNKAISLLDGIVPGSIDYAIFPETMIVEPIEEALLDKSPNIQLIREKAAIFGLKGIFTGAFTKRSSGWHPSDNDKVTNTTNPYVLYNSMLFLTEGGVEVYHKQKLVPLVEKQPFLWLMRPLRRFVESRGGFFGSYGTHNEREYFLLGKSVAAAPLICFESAFACHPKPGEIPSFMVLITNDGWWSSSGGYLQHLNLARLRAIERRQWIARAANTGVSCLISPEGEVIYPVEYEQQGLIIGEVFATHNTEWACWVMNLIRWTALSVLMIFALFALKYRLGH